MAKHTIHRISSPRSQRGRWINIASCSNSTSEALTFATIPKWVPIPAWVPASRGNGLGLQRPCPSHISREAPLSHLPAACGPTRPRGRDIKEHPAFFTFPFYTARTRSHLRLHLRLRHLPPLPLRCRYSPQPRHRLHRQLLLRLRLRQRRCRRARRAWCSRGCPRPSSTARGAHRSRRRPRRGSCSASPTASRGSTRLPSTPAAGPPHMASS